MEFSSLDAPHPVTPPEPNSRRSYCQGYRDSKPTDQSGRAPVPREKQITVQSGVWRYVIAKSVSRKYPVARIWRHQEIAERPLGRKQQDKKGHAQRKRQEPVAVSTDTAHQQINGNGRHD